MALIVADALSETTQPTSVVVTFSEAILLVNPSNSNDGLRLANYALTDTITAQLARIFSISSYGSRAVQLLTDSLVVGANRYSLAVSDVEATNGDVVSGGPTLFGVIDVSRITPPVARVFTDIALDEDGDLDVSTGDLRLLSDLDAVVQDVTIRLQFFRGEWFLDLDEGVPYYQEILVKNPRLTAISALFSEAILTTPMVTEVNDLALTYDTATRSLVVSCSLVIDTGIDPTTIPYSKTFVIGAV